MSKKGSYLWHPRASASNDFSYYFQWCSFITSCKQITHFLQVRITIPLSHLAYYVFTENDPLLKNELHLPQIFMSNNPQNCATW